ncbi:AAA family ATPase [Nocardia suismassiliense]|uniref:AAA family ATPase n=1 Tax=Nocardia suismassiliense TaxID=2077092 RepID=A0ABW6R7A5_9NOCA
MDADAESESFVGCNSTPFPVLVVIRGNSGSGKSTVAAAVRRRFERGACALVAQDTVRREMLGESDDPGAFNIRLIEQIATSCLREGLVVIVEGILTADKYGLMLERLAGAARPLFYSFDLTLEQTHARHAGRAQAASITEEMITEWYRPWKPLTFVDEIRLDGGWTVEALTERIWTDITRARR